MQVEARNVWVEADSDTILSLTFSQADKFKCLDRGLYSDYLSSEEKVHYFSVVEVGRAPKLVMLAKLTGGLRAFCIRLVCQLSKVSSAGTGVWQQYTALIFLEEKAAIMQRGWSNNPRWPGLKLCERR